MHYWYDHIKTYSQDRRLWSYFWMNGAFRKKFQQSFTFVIHPGTVEPSTGQPWTGYCYDRFNADGSTKGVWVSSLRWHTGEVQLQPCQFSPVEVIEEFGFSRTNVPLKIPLPPDLADRERAQVWFKGLVPITAVAGYRLPTQWNNDKSALLCQLPMLGANELSQSYVLIPAKSAAPPIPSNAEPARVKDLFSFRIAQPVHRQNFLRGESIPVKLVVTQETKALSGPAGQVAVLAEPYPSEPQWAAPQGGSPPPKVLPFRLGKITGGIGAVLQVPTGDLAAGEYRLVASLRDQAKLGWSMTKVLRFRLCPPSTYRYEIGGWGGDPISQAEHNLSTCILTGPKEMDDCLRLGMKFSLRTDVYYNIQLAQEHPEVRMKRPDGTDMPFHAADKSRPTPCLLNPLERETAVTSQRAQVKAALPYPAMSKFMYTSDDVHLYSWGCYCDTCKQRFKELTGRDAPQLPTAEEKKAKQGIVSEDDPWLQWNLFRCGEVYAGYNQALVKATQELVTNVKLGAVSGPMQRPLMYPVAGLNPAQDQGAWTLLNYYYYPHYLFPLASNLFYSELARLGGRDKEVGTLGDCYGPTVEQTHLRNSFYNLLAAGNHTMQFFTWPERQPEAAEELKKLGQITRRYGNLFLELKRPARPIGLLVPFTTAIFNTEWPHGSAQASFLNLLCAHQEAEPVGEEEIIAGRARQYKAIIVADVAWLRRACYDKLVEYAKSGGTVLVDATTKVDIPGARRVDVSFAGAVHYATDSADPLGISYARPEVIDQVRKLVTPLSPPFAKVDTPLFHLRRFQGEGATYLWAVNAYSREEFGFLFQNCQFWRGEDKWIGREKLKEYLRSRGAYEGRFTANVSIPAGNWAVYDVLAGKPLSTRPDGGRVSFTVDVQRFGGTLLALYPAAVNRVEVRAAAATAGKATEWIVRVLDANGKPVNALQPIELEVLDPKGQGSEYSGHHVARAGVLLLTPTIAVNDLQGKWQVRATELSSGKTGSAEFRVQ